MGRYSTEKQFIDITVEGDKEAVAKKLAAEIQSLPEFVRSSFWLEGFVSMPTVEKPTEPGVD